MPLSKSLFLRKLEIEVSQVALYKFDVREFSLNLNFSLRLIYKIDTTHFVMIFKVKEKESRKPGLFSTFYFILN